MSDKIDKITDFNGIDGIIQKWIEEASELSVAMLEDDREHIKEELADTLVIIQQIVKWFGFEDEEIEEEMDFKINRTINRMKEGYYNEK